MKLHVFTHASHVKGGNTATTYDGPLTGDGRLAVEQNRNALDTYNATYRGAMIRHAETAAALGVDAIISEACCNDTDMFALVENSDEISMDKWFAFLDQQKAAGVQSLLVVTSRLYPMIMLYRQLGGKAKFGCLLGFCNACEKLMALPGVIIPQLAQASLTEWDY